MAESVDGSDTKIRLNVSFLFGESSAKKANGQKPKSDPELNPVVSSTKLTAAAQTKPLDQKPHQQQEQKQQSPGTSNQPFSESQEADDQPSSKQVSKQAETQKLNRQDSSGQQPSVQNQAQGVLTKKRNDFWNYRHRPKSDNPRPRQTANHHIAQQSIIPSLEAISSMSQEQKLKYAYQMCRNTNTRAHRIRASSKHLMRQLEHTRLAIAANNTACSLSHYLAGATSTSTKPSQFPLIFKDQKGRTLQGTAGITTVHSGTVDNFLKRNIHGGQASYLQEVANFGNFSFHPRKRRRHHYQ